VRNDTWIPVTFSPHEAAHHGDRAECFASETISFEPWAQAA
jgi:hypothetical protein